MLARTAGGYAAGLALLTAYGGIVCPVMGGFGAMRLAAILGAGFAAALALEAIDWRMRPGIDPVVRWTLQWSRWMLPGMAVFLAEVMMTDTSMGIMFASSAKMGIASITLGFFVSSWICLGLERQWYLDQKREGRNSPSRPYLSIASRILGFSMRAALGIGIVILILIAKQMGKPVDRMLMLEVGLVLGVMLAALAVITINYRRNFELLYRFQLDVLQSVREGQLETSVPLVSSDEFRSIAEGTNEMIAGLREREKLRATFGKHFSPETAKRILAAGGGLGGEAMEVTVLFTDLRDYTRLAEGLPPETVVMILNEYFTMVVDCVRRNGGEVDKFIGDAAMAVFGMYGTPDSCEAAVRAAAEMRAGMVALRKSLVARGLPDIESGIGIHHGRVVAGNMGSPDRVEHTIIGDAVNVAARLESATKELGHAVAISGAVFQRLPPAEQAQLTFHGDYDLKGKTEKVPVYGFKDVTRATPVRRG